MNLSHASTTELLDRAATGSHSAIEELLAGHRPHLRQMVAVRLDTRLKGRVDPSDVVQEVLAEAHGQLVTYLRERPLPFHLWLRRLALDQLSKLHREHIVAQRRSVVREVFPQLSDDSIALLADRMNTLSPSRTMLRDELRRHVQQALDELPVLDRELLIMKYVEQLKLTEIAAALEITLPAAKARHLRALSHMSQHLGRLGGKP